MQDTRTFKLTNLSPIGFKVVNYPTQYCCLCRGYLTEVCNTCMERGSENCNIVKSDGSYYHQHCLAFMNSDTKKPPAKGKKYVDTSDEESG